MMFFKNGRTCFYAAIPNGAKIEGIFNDLGTKHLKADGSLYPMWPISPKRIKILEHIINNPRASVNSIAFALLYSQKQEASEALGYLCRPTLYLLWKEEYARYSVVPDKLEETKKFIQDYRNNTVFEPELMEVKNDA